MNKKLNIVVLCGGQSAEHEISILSAQNVIGGLNSDKYQVIVIYLSQQGQWYQIDPSDHNFDHQKENPLVLIPGSSNEPFALEKNMSERLSVDCVIPMLHGTCGEDGSVQGLLDILDVPYVGSDVLGSSLCMQKHIAKCILRSAGLLTSNWIYLDAKKYSQFPYKDIVKSLGNTVFVKPCSLGSSVGISKVLNEEEYHAAVQNAFQYDNELIVEQFIDGREIECSVLGNDEPIASLPGEFITRHSFYSYEAKYYDSNDLEFITPAELPVATVTLIQDMAIKVYQALHCAGMARVDFFLTKQQEIFINEVNTIPGFTDVSMYPMNWAASGLEFSNLLDDLIQLAMARYHKRSQLSHYYLGQPGESKDVSPRGKELK